MSYHRKRVALACTFCRSRKRRCDALKPSCSHCKELDVECHYDDTQSQRIDTSGGTREILSRIRDLETLIQAQSQQIEILTQNNRQFYHSSQLLSSPRASSINFEATQSCAAHLLTGFEAHAEIRNLPPLTIPVKHKTSSSYLLGLAAIESLIGKYPTDIFFLLESKNQSPTALSFGSSTTTLSPVNIPRNVSDELVESFFVSAHKHHPILDRDEFQASYQRFLDFGPTAEASSALCMVVFALGAVTKSKPSLQELQINPPGMQYMHQAMPTLLNQSSWCFTCELILPQALVLASVYFAYIVRPLQSWRLVYSATTIIQVKLSRADERDTELNWRESIIRLFWSCFLVECDRLAELELPRSGLQQLTDEISLPECTNIEIMQSTCYLAEISIRRLLNRIHNSLYPKKNHILTLSTTTLTANEDFSIEHISMIGSICDELHSQLELWHSSIPESFRPQLFIQEPGSTDRQSILRIRYFAARHIIYRPFLLYIINHGMDRTTDYMIEKAALCVESCRYYIHSTTPVLTTPSQYTWTFSLSSLGAIMVLTLASLSPVLSHLVPDIDELQTEALENIKPWAFSSLEAVVEILEGLQKKQRFLSRV